MSYPHSVWNRLRAIFRPDDGTYPDANNVYVVNGSAITGPPVTGGANNSVNATITTNVELGSNAGSREVGILIILQGGDPLYLSFTSPAGSGNAYLENDGDSVFLPTNDSVYGITSATSSSVSIIEI